MKAKICPRCLNSRPNVGPWNGEGGFTELCGVCKCEITLSSPERVKKLKDFIGEMVTYIEELESSEAYDSATRGSFDNNGMVKS